MRPSICAIVLVSGSLTCVAQSKRYLLEETNVRAGMQQQFESAQKEYCTAVVRGGAPSCLVLSPTTLSAPNRYWILLSFGSFGHYDEGTYTSRGMTPGQAHDLSRRRTPAIASGVESAIELKDPSEPGQPDFAPIILITEVHVAPGEAPAFLKLVHDFEIPASRAAALGTLEAYQTVADGDPDRLFIFQYLHNFAELDAANPIQSAIPAAKREIFDTAFAKYVRSISVSVMRYRQDLSAFAK